MITESYVLEHIEPEMLDQVLTHLRELTRVVGYFVIATRPDRSKLLPDGTNPHKIIESAEWWVNRIDEYFEIISHEVMAGEVRMICV